MQHAPPLGALTQLWASTAKETASANGRVDHFLILVNEGILSYLQFLIPWARYGEQPQAILKDPKAGEKLWGWLEE